MSLRWCLTAAVVVSLQASLVATYDCNNHDYALSEDGVKKCPYLYDLLERALLRNETGNLYRIKQAFFPSNEYSPHEVRVKSIIYVNFAINTTCKDKPASSGSVGSYYGCSEPYCHDFTYTWRSMSSSRSLFRLNSIAYEAIRATVSYEGFGTLLYAIIFSLEEPDHDVLVNLTIDHGLSCIPESKSVHDVMSNLISWLKSYAVSQGRPSSWDPSNKGVVRREILHTKAIRNLVLAVYMFTSVCVTLVLIRVTPGLYNSLVTKISQATRVKQRMYSLVYWGCTTVMFYLVFLSIVCDIIVSLIFVGISYFRSSYIIKSFILVYALKLFLHLVEVFVCVVIIRKTRNKIDFPFKWFRNIFCCCCCFCRCCSNSFKHKAVQVLALWSIMSFIQRVFTSTVPLVFTFVTAPQETFAVLVLLLSAFFCMIMLMSHVFYMCQSYGSSGVDQLKSSKTFIAVQFGLVAVILGTIIVIVALFLEISSNGRDIFNSLGATVVSLFPPVILAGFMWFVRKRFLQRSTPSESSENETNSYEDLEAD